jgi:hypothetical protein
MPWHATALKLIEEHYGTLDFHTVTDLAADHRVRSGHEEDARTPNRCGRCGVVEAREGVDPLFHPEAYLDNV